MKRRNEGLPRLPYLVFGWSEIDRVRKEQSMVRRMGMSLHVLGRVGTVIVLLIAFGTSLIFGQGGTATILGVVRDTSGALIPGVTISVKHVDSGLTRTVVSSEQGGYVAPLLPVGPYEVSAMIPGFKQQVRSGINLVVGQQAIVDLTLEVGGNAEQVTVSVTVRAFLPDCSGDNFHRDFHFPTDQDL